MSNVIRFQFSKGSKVRFLSHLDLLRTMERAVRRANLPIAYSGGFTPRPVMSFSFALSVGVLSIAEYGDYAFTKAIEPCDFIQAYNDQLPDGFKVLQAEILPEEMPALQREIDAASWRVFVPETNSTLAELKERWQWLKDVDSFMVERETKRGTREIDVRPFLYSVEAILPVSGGTQFDCFCGLGNQINLRMKELGELLNFDHLQATITRTGQFKKIGNDYFPPLGSRA